jgi:Asp/Glu/hydantoin racemase
MTLGILVLDGKMADEPGCMACEATFSYPVIRHVVAGAQTPFDQESARALLPAYVAAAREVQARGASVITANCGLIALLQPELSAAVRVPVVTSSLVAVPLVHRIAGGRPVGVLTFFTAAVDEANFRACGWSADDVPVVVNGVGRHESWLEFLRTKEIDERLRARLRADLRQTIDEMLDIAPDLGAIVCECTMIPAVLDDVRRELPIPVYDILTVLDWAMSGFARSPQAALVP